MIWEGLGRILLEQGDHLNLKNVTVILIFSFHHSYLLETFFPGLVNKGKTMFSYITTVLRFAHLFSFLNEYSSSYFQNIPIPTRVQ